MDNKQTQLSNFSNPEYSVGRSFFVQILWYIVNHLVFNSYIFPFYSLKIALLKAFGANIGEGVLIKPKVNIKYPWKLKIANNVWIGEGVWIDNLELVEIQSNVCISQGALLLCGNHNYSKSAFDLISKPIVLERGVWVGAKSVVTGGVVCKDHSVIAALSLCSANTEAYSIYRGNPAVKVKDRNIE
jgi:putative colanic acid biosynthesis acetyltransferase WcaF